MPTVLSPRDLVFRLDNMDETVPHKYLLNLPVSQLLNVLWYHTWNQINVKTWYSYLFVRYENIFN